jgi:predicted transposase YbfD/YdcC
MADCDHFDAIASWGEENLPFLRRYLPYEHGVPGGRWLTLLMNRVDPALFSAAFTAWVRETWPERPELIAIDGKTSRRSHDRAEDKAPLHLVSAFATTSRLVLGQEAVEGKSNELSAIPVLLDRLSEGGGLKGALVSIDAIATNAKIAQAIVDKGADYLLAVKANQPTLRAEIESAFTAATSVDACVDLDKGHGRIERRGVSVLTEVDWLNGERRFPGELRLPKVATIIRVKSRAELSDRGRFETRYYISSARLSAKRAGEAVRGHWGIENQLHWVLDVVFAEDQSRLRKGHGARNMAVVRHFAVNMVRTAPEPERRPPMKPQRKATKPRRTSIALRRKIAGWRDDYLAIALGASAR